MKRLFLLLLTMGSVSFLESAHAKPVDYASLLFPDAHGQCVIMTCLNGTQSYSIGCGGISQSCSGSGPGSCSDELDFSQSCNSQYMSVVH